MPRLRILSGVIALLLLLNITRAQTPSWQPIGLSGGGAMYNPVISPADSRLAIVHCDMSAAYLTHDGGNTWQMIDTSQLRSNTICRAAFHPTDPRIMFSPHGSSEIKVSRDGGTHWENLAQFDADLTGLIAIDPHEPSRMLVGAGKTVCASNDGGKTWRACPQVKGAFVGAHFTKTGTIFIATEDGVWQSTDRGASWTDLSAGLPAKGLRNFSGGTGTSQTTLYCTIPGKSQDGRYAGGIYRWIGKSWEPANGSGLNLDIKKFDQWAENSVAQYFDITTSDDHPEIVWTTNTNTGVPPPHHASIYRSDDSGQNWHATFYPDPRYKGFNVQKDYVVTEAGQFYQNRYYLAQDPRDPEHVLCITEGQAYHTLDGGKTWRCGHAQGVGDPNHPSAWKCTGLVVTTTWNYYIDPHEPKRHYICYTDIGFARSLDAGQTWLWWPAKNSSPWRNTTYELAFDPERPGKIWGAFSEAHDIPNDNVIFNRHNPNHPGGLCLSDDFAATWKTLAGGLPKIPATSIIVDPKSPRDNRTLYAGFFGTTTGGVYKSTDDGKTWTPRNSGLGDPSNMRVCRVQLHPDGTLFAVVTALVKGNKFLEPGPGLYRSTNGGDSWQCISKSIPALWPKDFTLDPSNSRTLYLALCDANGKETGGLYRTTDGGNSWSLLVRLAREHFGAYLHPHHPGWIYATCTEDAPTYGLFLSKDNGKTFQPLKGMPFDNAMRVAFDPADPNTIYVTAFGGSVWRGPAD